MCLSKSKKNSTLVDVSSSSFSLCPDVSASATTLDDFVVVFVELLTFSSIILHGMSHSVRVASSLTYPSHVEPKKSITVGGGKNIKGASPASFIHKSARVLV